MPDRGERSRRRFLRLVGAGTAVGVAGCGGQQQNGTPAGGPGEGTPDLSGPVPEEYRTATSLGGRERDPDALDAKAEVSYQSQPNQGNQCSGCIFYIPDMDGDGLGACSEVDGLIEPEGWCVDFAPTGDGG